MKVLQVYKKGTIKLIAFTNQSYILNLMVWKKMEEISFGLLKRFLILNGELEICFFQSKYGILDTFLTSWCMWN